MKKRFEFLFIVWLCCLSAVFAQNQTDTTRYSIRYEPFQDCAGHWYSIADKHNVINALPDQKRYRPTQINEIAENILLFQKENGGWPKNYDYFAILSPEQIKAVKSSKNEQNSTFDNGTTYPQIEALALAYEATKNIRYKKASILGLNYILNAQYDNGGWPQYFPLEKGYSRHITYNDGAMVGVMILLKKVVDNDPLYSFVDESMHKRILKAFDRGLDCILKTQIVDNGVLTAWCQQHDEVTLQPAWARKFEPACICNKESSELVLFLMSIDQPSAKIINSVQQAVKWFEDSKIYNTRIKTIDATREKTEYRVSTHDRIVATDSTAPAIWTRYYEIGTHRPMFCNRDSKVVYSLAEVARERRDGYGWYTYAPQDVLKKYAKWSKKWILK